MCIKVFKENKGFTLVELLLVIALIGILSGVILGVLNIPGMRSKTRDSQRIADMKKIQIALGIYYVDNRRFPATENLAALSPAYLDNIPADPATGGNYCYASNGVEYLIATDMEVSTSADQGPCADLNVWGALGGNCSGFTNCYGVENP